MSIHTLTETDFFILQALGTYRYLTADHLVRLETAKNKKHLSRVLKNLRERKPPPLQALRHGVLPGFGKLPFLYYLTRTGSQLIAETQEDAPRMNFPKGKVSFRHDFFHRIDCISCEITVRLFAANLGHTVDCYWTYYENSGSNRSKVQPPRRSSTKIDLRENSLTADAAFRLTDSDGKSRLFLLEIYKGMRTKRVMQQLEKYCHAISQEAINTQFGYPHAPRILIVFDNPNALSQLRQTVTQSDSFIKRFNSFFFLKELDSFQADFRHNWQRLLSEPQNLF